MASTIAEMFNKIAPHYDGLNHLLSLNIDKYWRWRALRNQLSGQQMSSVLDVACGTADFAIALIKSGAAKVEGVDISEEMLAIGRKKVLQKGLSEQIKLHLEDVANLQYPDKTFGAVTVAFGVRNFQQRANGLSEMYRVLQNGGKLIILEFSLPQHQPIKAIYYFYFKHILPMIGGLFSGNRNAYGYLPNSVCAFPRREQFCNELANVGFIDITSKTYTFGIATVYYASK